MSRIPTGAPSRARRRSLAVAPLSLALAGALLLSGCATAEPRGAGDVEALEPVSLTVHEDGTPEVTVDGTIEAGEVSSRVLQDGDGEDIDAGDVALVKTAVVDPATGEVMADNFTQGSEAVFIDESLQQGDEVLYSMLEQNSVGAQVAYFRPGLGQGSTDQLMVFQIDGKTDDRASGAPVEDVDGSLPAVTLDEESGEPTIATPEGEAPEELVVQPLIQGDGEEIGPNDYVTLQYKGVKWSDGEEFDSTWSRGTLFGTTLDRVVAGWGQGLEGQKVGSQVMLVIPPELGYGGSEGHDLQEETMVFVVDIIHSMSPAQPAEQPTEPAEPSPTEPAAPQSTESE